VGGGFGLLPLVGEGHYFFDGLKRKKLAVFLMGVNSLMRYLIPKHIMPLMPLTFPIYPLFQRQLSSLYTFIPLFLAYFIQNLLPKFLRFYFRLQAFQNIQRRMIDGVIINFNYFVPWQCVFFLKLCHFELLG